MSPFRLWLTLGALSIPIILVSIDLNGIVVLLPQIGSDLGASADEVGSIVTVASITSCAPLLLVGRVATRVGSRRLLLFGIALLWIAAVICTFTESFSLMMFGRALEGLGAACCFTTSLAVIDYLFDSKKCSPRERLVEQTRHQRRHCSPQTTKATPDTNRHRPTQRDRFLW